MRATVSERRRVLTAWPGARAWLGFLLQVCLVVGIELSDDGIRGLVAPRTPGPAQANAVRVMEFEQAHGFWIEPAMQRFFEQPHQVLGLTTQWSQVVPAADAIYGLAHGLITAVVAAWVFWRRRALFPLVRNVFVCTGLLSVAIYNVFPLAPPRLATGLRYDGRPFHFVDTVFANGGVNLSFDQYAAMPSLHVAWALIAGLTLFWAARSRILRVLGLCHPVLMSVAVIITGNHYIADCLGALAMVIVSYALVLLLSLCRGQRSGGRQQERRGWVGLRTCGPYG